MRATRILRLASVLAFLQFGAHTFLFLTATPKHGQDEIAVIEAMKSHRFDFLGFSRSYWDFYFGYGLLAAFVVFIEAVLFWQLATLAKIDPSRIRPIVALFLFAKMGHAILCLKYFFITPVVPDIVIAICLGFALVTLRAESHPSAGRV